MATNENLTPNVIKQLAKELKNLDEAPPEGIKVGVNDEDFSTIYAAIEGPAGTPYENGVFHMKLILSHDFPHSPPKGLPAQTTQNASALLTMTVFCGRKFSSTLLRCLLIEPFPESALNEQAGKMLLENYDEYARHARLYTGIHALKPKPKFKTGAISTALNVDQTNTSVLIVDPKNAAAGATLQLPSPLAPNTNAAARGASGQDQPIAVSDSVTETGVGGSTTWTTAPVTLKKEVVGLAKVNADKRKMDARKKSLKRL